VRIAFGSFFSSRTADVGNHVTVGGYCIIGNVKIGDHVLIASRVSLMSGKYQHGSALTSAPASPDGGISIGNRTWVGEGSIVAASVGSDCIVAAGSVVMRDVPDGHMAAGNPARPMKMEPKTAERSVPAEATS
jgi:acetyltransferase-like isoleucine patch superfamily enzyme